MFDGHRTTNLPILGHRTRQSSFPLTVTVIVNDRVTLTGNSNIASHFFDMKALALCLLYVVLTAASTPLAADTRHSAEDAGITSINSDVETKVTFVNHTEETIRIYWLSFEGKRVLYHTLKPGESAEQVTFLTHPWLITDENDNAWQLYYPDAQPRKIEIKVEPPGEQ